MTRQPEPVIHGRRTFLRAAERSDVPAIVPWFNDYATTTRGSTRYFDSPPLQGGGTYTYEIKASWMQDGQPVTAQETVSVTAGTQMVVDFTQSPPKVIKVR